MKQKTLGKLFPYLLILPSLVILAGVVFYPIAASLLRSFQLEEGGWGLDNYIYFFTDPDFFTAAIFRVPQSVTNTRFTSPLSKARISTSV